MNVFGVVSDVHLHKWSAFSKTLPSGVNSRLQDILNELKRAAKAVVEAGGSRLVITGDLFHVRGSIAPSVLNPTIKTFQELHEIGIETIEILAGNHDLESKNASQLTNANVALSSMPFITVISEPMYIEEQKAMHIPWVENCDDLMGEIDKAVGWLNAEADTPAREVDLFIHAPMDDVLPNMPGHGLNPDDLKAFGFNRVFCGHYHNHKEVRANVFSVGATTHQTWGDTASTAGFILVLGDEILHIESAAPHFIDFDPEMDSLEAAALCEGNYVRVKLDEADPSEIAEMRGYLIEDLHALDCVIQAQPKSKVVARSGGVAKSASLRDSVTKFIDTKTMTVEKTDVQRECEDILTHTGAV